MAEDFVDDIIAAASPAEPQSADTDEASAATPVVDDSPADKATPDGDQDSGPALTIEEIASQLGWKPDHTGENFVDAATYILRSKEIQNSMKDHNKDLKNQLQNLQGSVDALKEHNERVYKAELSRMEGEIARLKKEKRAAIETADVDKVDELEQEISSLEKNLNAPKPKAPASTNPIYDEWVKDNSWYLTNNEMAAYADTVAQQYAGAPLDRLYPLVRQKVAEVFPEQFQQAAPAQPGTLANSGKPLAKPKPVGPASPVEGGKKGGQNKSFTKADLTPDQISIMNQFVKSGIMTEEQYIKDISKLQEA
jgi:hypothetical protein